MPDAFAMERGQSMTLHRRRARGLLVPLAVALTLGACSAGDEPSPTQSPTPSASSESSSEASPTEPQQTEESATPAASGEKVSQEQIQAAIDAFVKKHEGAQEIPGSDIKPSELDEVSKGVKVEPKECRDAYLRLQDPDLPQTGKTHVAMHRNTGLGNLVWLSIQEYETAEDARRMATVSDEPGPSQCKKMKIETNGMTVTVEYTERKPPKFDNVELTSAMQLVETIPGGASTTTNSVLALKGNVVVSSSLHSVEDSFTPEDADAIVRDALEAMDQ